MNNEHYRKLENMYQTAPINGFYEPTMVVSHQQAEITIELRQQHFHAANAVHGSVYFKMLDDAAFFAANSVVEEVFVLTTSFNLHFLRPVSEGQIRAVGTLVFNSKALLIAEAKLFNAQGKAIAFGTGHFAKSRIPLTEDIGYR